MRTTHDNELWLPHAISPMRHGDVGAVVRVLERAWEAERGDGPITEPALHALEHTGAMTYTVRGLDGEIEAAAIAFRCTDRPLALYLHVVGVAETARDKGLGKRLLRQLGRDAAKQGFVAIEWTFDPLVARNAHLYLAALGAEATSYMADAYGQINDPINGTDPSDRLLVRWDLIGPRAPSPPDDAPSAISLADNGIPELTGIGAPIVGVPIPSDIQHLRRERPLVASAWRTCTKEILDAPGRRILGLDRHGRYVVGQS